MELKPLTEEEREAACGHFLGQTVKWCETAMSLGRSQLDNRAAILEHKLPIELCEMVGQFLYEEEKAEHRKKFAATLDQIKYFIDFSKVYGKMFRVMPLTYRCSSSVLSAVAYQDTETTAFKIAKADNPNIPDVTIPERAFDLWFQYERDRYSTLRFWLQNIGFKASLYRKAEVVWLASEAGQPLKH